MESVRLRGSGANLKSWVCGGKARHGRTELGTGTLQGSALRSRDHRAVRAVVPDVQIELSRPGPDDGRARHCAGPHDPLEVGESVTCQSLRNAGSGTPCRWAI